MSDPEDVEERRGFDRRVFELEHKVSQLMMTTALTDERVKGLASTMESRHKAFDRGIDLILLRLKNLEDIKNKVAGAAILAQLLAVSGIIGGAIAIVKLLKGSP